MQYFRLGFVAASLACVTLGAAWSQGLLPDAPRHPPPPPTDLDAQIMARLEGGTSVTVAPIRSGGRVVGCAVNFLGVARDHANRRGGVVALNGSVTIFSRLPDQIFWAIKIAPSDLVLSQAGEIEWRRFTPSAGWVRTGAFASSNHEQAPFECEGGGLCASGVGGMAQLAEALPMSRLEIGIQRRRGGLDFSWTAEPSRSAQALDSREAFPRCMIELLDSFGAR